MLPMVTLHLSTINHQLSTIHYEMDAREIVEESILCLMPFVPIMQHGEDLLDQADSLLYQSALSREDKADMLTVMTIFSGLISDKLPRMLVAKRRDIMIESAAYDVNQTGRTQRRTPAGQDSRSSGGDTGLPGSAI